MNGAVRLWGKKFWKWWSRGKVFKDILLGHMKWNSPSLLLCKTSEQSVFYFLFLLDIILFFFNRKAKNITDLLQLPYKEGTFQEYISPHSSSSHFLQMIFGRALAKLSRGKDPSQAPYSFLAIIQRSFSVSKFPERCFYENEVGGRKRLWNSPCPHMTDVLRYSGYFVMTLGISMVWFRRTYCHTIKLFSGTQSGFKGNLCALKKI